MSPRWSLPLAAVLGIVSALNFAPYRFPFVMLASVAALFWLISRLTTARRRHLLAVGAAYGLGFMGVLIWWMNAVSTGAYIALVFAEVLFFALIVATLRASMVTRAWPLVAAAIWTLGEEVRGAYPFSGFPWGRLAHTSLDTPLEGWVRLIGMTGTTFLMALLAACVVLVVQRRWWAAAPIAAALLIGAVLPIGLAGPTGESSRIALIQGNTPGPFLQWPRSEIFDLHVEATASIDEPVDLVIWPENGSDLDPFTNAYAKARLAELVEQVGAPILVGAILDGPDDESAYNAGVLVDGNGPQEDFYIKQNVVPYGEYVPFRRQLGSLVPRFDRDIPRDLLPGDEPGAFTVGDLVVGDTICWDIAYDGAVSGAIKSGAHVMVVQTSNASFMDFGGATQPEQQWDIARLRAIETGRWVLVPSTNGVSGVIDADGAVVERVPTKQPAVMIHDVPLAEGITGAVNARIWVIGLVTLLAVAGWFAGARTLRRNR